jgi:DNA polymerase-4
MASREAKPDGLLVVEPADEAAFLHPLAVERLWGVGPTTAQKLHARGIHTVGELARRGEAELALFLGPAAARHLHAVSRNRDPRPVRPGRRRGSFGSQSALGGAPRSRGDLEARLVALVDRVTRRMRSSRRAGRTVTLRLRFGDFSRATRSRTLPHPTAGTGAILAAARTLLSAAMPVIERRGITLLGVAVSNLAPRGCGDQLELPLDRPHDAALDTAIDAVRDRFGPDAIRRAASLSRDPTLSPWLRPGEEAATRGPG